MRDWRQSTWGDEISLEYGKSLRDYAGNYGPVRVYGSNGPIGHTDKALSDKPGVILGRKGAYRGVEYSKIPFFVIDTAYYVVPKTDLDMRWIYYAIKYHKLGEIDDGSPIPSTTRAAVYVRDLEVPKPQEQKAIAAVLGALDDKIELNRRMNTTLEAMARALFKSWFVDFDPVKAKIGRAKMAGKQPQEARSAAGATESVLGFMDAATADLLPSRLVPSPLGDIPEGWSIVPVIDSAEFINGAAYKNMHFSNAPDALPVIKIAELKNGISPGTQYTNSDLGQKFRLDTGDILFSWSGSPDTSIDTFIYTGGPAWLNQHIFKVVSENNEKRCFTYWLLKYLNPTFIEIARDKQTTGLGHVTRADMQRLKFAEPSEDIVKAFYQKAGALMDAIQSNLSQAEHLAKIRDYLLPKLISGDIRIPDAEKFVEAA